eukprot:631482-Rhodomonas_salina.2
MLSKFEGLSSRPGSSDPGPIGRKHHACELEAASWTRLSRRVIHSALIQNRFKSLLVVPGDTANLHKSSLAISQLLVRYYAAMPVPVLFKFQVGKHALLSDSLL